MSAFVPLVTAGDRSEAPLFCDALSQANKLAGEANINEFLPYTLLSISNKVFYATLFAMYSAHVQNNGGDSSNGITYSSPAVNIVNASSVVVTGFALSMLSALSGRNAWRFRRIVQELEIPASMRDSLNAVTTTRGLKISHTACASVINMANGLFQLAQHGVFSSDAMIKAKGERLAKDTALPALVFILSKNAFDFVFSTIELAVCQRNIRLLRKESLLIAPYGTQLDDSSTIRDALVVHLIIKRKNLTVTAVSTGLVTTGMFSLMTGMLGYIPVSVAATIFLVTATAGQLIPVCRTCRSNCKQKSVTSSETPASDLRSVCMGNKNELIKAVAERISTQSGVGSLVQKIRTGFCCRRLTVDGEQANGFEELTNAL